MNLLFQNDTAGEHPDSWYRSSIEKTPSYPQLGGDQRCDVVIVGAGYTGLSTALFLAEKGVSVTVLEAHRVGWGASGRNGGQVGSGYNLDQKSLASMVGAQSANDLWQISENAKAKVVSLTEQSGSTCELENGIAFAHLKKRAKPAMLNMANLLEKDYGYTQISFHEGEDVKKLVGTEAYPIALLDRGAYHLNPLKFSLSLATLASNAGAIIHENTLVTALKQNGNIVVSTAQGTVTADHAVLACNGYLGSLDSEIAKRVMPINNFIAATEPLDELPAEQTVLPSNISVFDSKFVVNYFRLSSDNRLIFGGGENYGYKYPADIASLVRKPMTTIFPQLRDIKIDYAWGGTLAITVNRFPCFRCSGDNLWSASGYSGHGVALATYAGTVLGNALLGDTTEFDLLSSVPINRFPGGARSRGTLQRLAMSFGALVDRLP